MDLFGIAKGHNGPCHFKDYEMGVNCIVLLVVVSLWEGGVFVQFWWPKRLLSLGAIFSWGKNQDVLGVLTAKVAWCVVPCSCHLDGDYALVILR